MQHDKLHNSDKWLLGGGAAVAGTMLAPTVLPFLGIGSGALAAETVNAMHGLGVGTGLAGGINSLLASVPGIGDTLVTGGAPVAAIVAGIGIGGFLLGKFIEKRGGDFAPKIGKMIRYASLATSALIALPAALTAISIGIVYTATALLGPQTASGILDALQSTLGVTGEASVAATGLTGVAATIPHLLTCGASVIPAALAFMADRQEKEPPQSDYQLHIETGGVPQMGKQCEALLSVTDKNGKRITAENLDVVHTRKLHLFIADDSLRDYQHIHPEPTAEPGVFAFSFTPRTKNAYGAWAEFQTTGSGKTISTHTKLAHHATLISPAIKPVTEPAQDGLYFHWQQSEPLEKNKDSVVQVDVMDANGKPFAGLEPVMGAYAHLVGFSTDRKTMLHCHPLGAEPQHAHERGGPTLRFHVRPNFDGPVQFFLQVQRGGKDVFVPFAERIRPSEKMADKSVHAPQAHGMAH